MPRKTDNIGCVQTSPSLERLCDERRSSSNSPLPQGAQGTTVTRYNVNNRNKENNDNNISSSSAAYNNDERRIMMSNVNARPVAKRVPSDVNRYLAAEIRRHISSSLKQRKGDFPCYFVSEFVTFALPGGMQLDFLFFRCHSRYFFALWILF